MIKVGNYLNKCPQVWVNYINSVNPDGKLNDWEVDEITLRDWNGVFHANNQHGGGYVKFLTEGDEILFMLRWS